ncbi:hypothetical protein GQ53DRAFT_800391 [Thozetella sp. PMI_491]|nr:hypothetical protein GQ53DRAFT_800391 [Thozetella sp. PMI_491]
MLPLQCNSDLALPRILCLHGGGSNARIFRAQCRVLLKQLEGRFRACFVQAPFPSAAGPDVLSVYKAEVWGSFRAWIPAPTQATTDSSDEEDQTYTYSALWTRINKSLDEAMRRDDDSGAAGEWIGLLGFSQGAKVCASLLFRQQLGYQFAGSAAQGVQFRFAILVAGRGPLLVDRQRAFESLRFRLRLPTVHVHGLRDPGIDFHRLMRESWCERDSTRLLEWDGGHRMPIKGADVTRLAEHILAVARDTDAYAVHISQ